MPLVRIVQFVRLVHLVQFVHFVQLAIVYKRVPVSAARENWREVIARSEFGKEATVLTFRKKDVAAILPMSAVDLKDLGPEKKGSEAVKKPKKIKAKQA